MVKRGLLLAAVLISWVVGMGAFCLQAQGACQRAEPAVLLQLGPLLQKHISLPYPIPGTPLQIIELVIYDGISLEDGSVEELAQVAALLIQNTGTQTLESGEVELWQGERQLRFSFQYLSPGATVMALEADRRLYQPGDIIRCRGSVVPVQSDLRALLAIQEAGSCTLHITNISNIPLRDIIVYFKNVDPETGIYMGGIAYEIGIHSLAPGQTHICRPGYYVAGESRIVHVKSSGLQQTQAGAAIIALWKENPANGDAWGL